MSLFFVVCCTMVTLMSLGTVVSDATPNFIPSTDFMEFWNSLSLSCGSNRNATKISESFDSCLKGIDDKYEPAAYRSYCRNPTKYLDCWDQYKHDLESMCRENNVTVSPQLYRGTFESFCRNDEGIASLDEFSKDFIRIQRNPFLGIMVAIQCLQKLGSFWKEACEQDLLNMASPDICLFIRPCGTVMFYFQPSFIIAQVPSDYNMFCKSGRETIHKIKLNGWDESRMPYQKPKKTLLYIIS